MSKRLFDIVISALLLLLLFPIFVLLVLSIRMWMGTPVFFTQRRPGKGEKPFEMIKFRTMTDEMDEQGNLLPDDQRLTKLGKFLRSTSLDELPELINVLKGDMSLVGPRPLLMKYLPRYNDYQRQRHQVRPGITGWAQINGRNELRWQEKFKLDVWYVKNRSFWLDLKILVITLVKVFQKEGISAEGSATMSEFRGN